MEVEFPPTPPRPKNAPKLIPKYCKNCEKIYYGKTKYKNFCSGECYYSFMQREEDRKLQYEQNARIKERETLREQAKAKILAEQEKQASEKQDAENQSSFEMNFNDTYFDSSNEEEPSAAFLSHSMDKEGGKKSRKRRRKKRKSSFRKRKTKKRKRKRKKRKTKRRRRTKRKRR